ncbi:MAG: protein kinase domain-containing protein, partial [Steroidobacteraceae bacterium]
LHIARGVVAGLVSAHGAGIVHRDLKPANIMIGEDDVPTIMDFGIARSAVRPIEGNVMHGTMPLSRSALVTGATMQGAVVGTVAYMSPEQAKGQPADQRSDIYSVGMIMRDMLVGMRAVENPTDALNELMARVEHAPKPVQEIDPSIPEDVDRIVTRCLQPDAAARYQSVQELLKELNGLDAEGNPLPKIRPLTKRVVGAAAVIVLTLLGTTWWLAQPAPEEVQPPPTSVLIADFQNRAGDPVFEGALEQALAIAMEGASFITVYPRRQAQQIAAAQIGADATLSEDVARLISRREGIKLILAGAIERQGSGYKVTVTALDPAIEPGKGPPLSTASGTAGDKGDVLRTLASVAARLRGMLGDTVPESARLADAETFTAGSVDAMRSYAKCQELFNAGRYEAALQECGEALKHDPQLGRAYAVVGSIYVNLKQTDRAEAAFQQALKHLDRMSEREKYRTLATYSIGVAGNYEKAIENYEALIKMFPADNVAYNNLALAYLLSMDVGRAKEVARKGLEIYPQNLMQRTNYAAYSVYAADFE